MIREIIIDNHVLKYQITYKNNKNTYFRFNRKGYIQINASKHQNPKEIIRFIKNNSKSFIEKYNRIKISKVDKNSYYHFGVKYDKITDKNINKIVFDNVEFKVKEPDVSFKQLGIIYKNMEKEILLDKLEKLKVKYLNNGLIDIKSLKFKARYMQTRFGSCNPIINSININLYLVNYDEIYLEYVFLHEITHLVHHNHSQDYYSLLEKLSINYKQLKKELNSKFNYR